MGWNYPVIKSLVRVDDDTVEPRFGIHEVHYKEDNDDHPVIMTPPVTPTTDDIRWFVNELVRALNKPALEIEGDGPIVFAHACKMVLEGVVSKRLGSAYRSGRSKDWL